MLTLPAAEWATRPTTVEPTDPGGLRTGSQQVDDERFSAESAE
ncbi:hypothetical protein [Nocardia salmonicida]